MWRQSDFRRAIQQQGCCLCEDKRKRLPRFFRETTKNPGLEDNKHALVQTTYTMVGRLYVDLTICWELLSGLYYQEFEAMLDASDVAIHRPSRTNEGTDWAYTTDGEPATPTACRETYDGGSTYKGRGNCGVPHYVYGETGKVLTKKDITGEETDERYAAADQFLLEEGARSSFLTILAHDLMEENKIEMPMNMPFTTLPPSKARSPRFDEGELLLRYPRILETRVIINRPSDVAVADPRCRADSADNCVQSRGNPLMGACRRGKQTSSALQFEVDDRGKTKELDPESQEVSAKEMFDSTVSILFQAMRMEGSTVPGSQFSTTGVRFDEGRNLGDIAGRPDGKANKNVVGEPDRGGLGSSFQTKVDGNSMDADYLGYAGLTKENTYSETTGPPQVLAFPWLPFFSNCRGFDSQIAYSKLLETHEDCRLSKHEDTRFIYDFDPLEQLLTKGMWESDAVADICVHDRALAAS